MATNNESKWFEELDKDLDAIDDMLTSLEVDIIYDESGIGIGEARPLVESTDIDLDRLPGCLDDTPCLQMPDILDDEVLPTSGIKVEEHTDTISRNNFVMEYLLRKDCGQAVGDNFVRNHAL